MFFSEASTDEHQNHHYRRINVSSGAPHSESHQYQQSTSIDKQQQRQQHAQVSSVTAVPHQQQQQMLAMKQAKTRGFASQQNIHTAQKPSRGDHHHQVSSTQLNSNAVHSTTGLSKRAINAMLNPATTKTSTNSAFPGNYQSAFASAHGITTFKPPSPQSKQLYIAGSKKEHENSSAYASQNSNRMQQMQLTDMLPTQQTSSQYQLTSGSSHSLTKKKSLKQISVPPSSNKATAGAAVVSVLSNNSHNNNNSRQILQDNSNLTHGMAIGSASKSNASTRSMLPGYQLQQPHMMTAQSLNMMTEGSARQLSIPKRNSSNGGQQNAETPQSRENMSRAIKTAQDISASKNLNQTDFKHTQKLLPSSTTNLRNRSGEQSQRRVSSDRRSDQLNTQTPNSTIITKADTQLAVEAAAAAKPSIEEVYVKQQHRRRLGVIEKAMKESDSDAEEDNIQDQLKEFQQQKQQSKPFQISDVNSIEERNCQVNLQYKSHILHFEFAAKSHTVEWLIGYLIRRIYHFEIKTVKSSAEAAYAAISTIVGFTSSTANIAVSYYFTQPNRQIALFNRKCLNITPLYFTMNPKFQQLLSEDPHSIIPYKRFDLDDFHLIRCIGLGGFSRVYLVQKKDSGKMFALKLLDKQFIIENRKEVIVSNERNIMTSISHPFLLKLEYAFESEKFLGFIMEYCAGGELFYHLRRIKCMNEDMARFYFVEICLGIDYLHKRHIIYRDIKPENILLDIDGHIRIGDFGLSKPDMDVNEFAYSFCGSPEYMAPEMLMKVGHTYPVDYYCLGALLYELVTGLPPYYCQDTDEIYQRILYENLTFPPHAQISEDLEDLLCELLTKNPAERLGIENGIRDIFAHPWFKPINIGDVLDKALDPPLKPNVLGFNFDEDEFSSGEKEFRQKILGKGNSQNEEDDDDVDELANDKAKSSAAKPIFADFYFDANLARLKRKQKQLSTAMAQQQQQTMQRNDSKSLFVKRPHHPDMPISNPSRPHSQPNQLSTEEQITIQNNLIIHQIQQQQIDHLASLKAAAAPSAQFAPIPRVLSKQNVQRKGSNTSNNNSKAVYAYMSPQQRVTESDAMSSTTTTTTLNTVGFDDRMLFMQPNKPQQQHMLTETGMGSVSPKVSRQSSLERTTANIYSILSAAKSTKNNHPIIGASHLKSASNSITKQPQQPTQQLVVGIKQQPKQSSLVLNGGSLMPSSAVAGPANFMKNFGTKQSQQQQQQPWLLHEKTQNFKQSHLNFNRSIGNGALFSAAISNHDTRNARIKTEENQQHKNYCDDYNNLTEEQQQQQHQSHHSQDDQQPQQVQQVGRGQGQQQAQYNLGRIQVDLNRRSRAVLKSNNNQKAPIGTLQKQGSFKGIPVNKQQQQLQMQVQVGRQSFGQIQQSGNSMHRASSKDSIAAVHASVSPNKHLLLQNIMNNSASTATGTTKHYNPIYFINQK